MNLPNKLKNKKANGEWLDIPVQNTYTIAMRKELDKIFKDFLYEYTIANANLMNGQVEDLSVAQDVMKINLTSSAKMKEKGNIQMQAIKENINEIAYDLLNAILDKENCDGNTQSLIENRELF